jgi:hypothetical protein
MLDWALLVMAKNKKILIIQSFKIMLLTKVITNYCLIDEMVTLGFSELKTVLPATKTVAPTAINCL